jgi:hypothetical protein
MRRIKKMMAIAMLAVMVSLGTQTAFAGNQGVLLSDRGSNPNQTSVTDPDLMTVLVVYLKTGIYLSTRNDGVLLSD